MTHALRLVGMVLGIAAGVAALQGEIPSARIVQLRCDSLVEPLGIDSKVPIFSWQIQDSSPGARQTAYEIQVVTDPRLLSGGTPDVWDSGKVASAQSIDVKYAGPALKPETRYHWVVKVWNKDGELYPTSDASWWETGLMEADNWQGKWIGYEEREEQAIRESGAEWITNMADPNLKPAGTTRHDFRLAFDLPSPIKRAVLYTTGQDTAAAWINGKQVLFAQPLPPWKQAPWQTYLSRDVTAELRRGKNSLAIEVTLYAANPNGMQGQATAKTPMSAVLYVEFADGSVQTFKSGSGWKAALNAAKGWSAPHFHDSKWQDAIPYELPSSPMDAGKLGHPWQTGSVKLLRQMFEIGKPVSSARLYATALGSYEFHINGHKVGNQILAPGWMDFRQHVPYQVYDVTADLQSGRNAIGAYLAAGWYSTPLMWFRQGYNYGDTPPALRAQLRIEYADHSVDWVATDATWKADGSPILKAEIYDGETYDARRVQQGWDEASFSDANWHPVSTIQPAALDVVAQYFEPIRVDKTLSANAITNPKPGVYIYDFGQNLAGLAKLRIQGAAGTDVQLRFAEVLNPDGSLYVDNLRTAKATDHYILGGNGLEEYQPRFTFHGFRYVELTGIAARPDMETLKAVAFHTDVPLTVELHTGSAMINQLWSNILWGQRSNFVGVPTDCPQRDERLGWSADAQVFWRAASYNMDLAQFTKKYAADLRGTQIGTAMYGIFAPGTATPNPGFGTGWSDAGVIIPWTGWLQFGDTRVVEQNWAAMERYLAAIESANPGHLWNNAYGIAFGDWLSPEGPTREPLIATAYWAYDASLMQQMAHALGKPDDEKKYAGLYDQIKAAFAKAYVHSDGFVEGSDNDASPFGQINNPGAKSKGGDTQTGYVLALYMKLVPTDLRAAAGEKLVAKIKANNWRLGTGFLGTPYLLGVLVDTGHADVAYRLLLNTDYPSWGYLVGHGATTMWERWNGDQMRGDPSMNSYNHYAYGAVADWIYRYAAGIDATPSDPGFHTIYLHPNFDPRLGSLDFSYQSPYGQIKSSWKVQGSDVTWSITVPANTVARLPLNAAQADTFLLDGQKLAQSPQAHLESSGENETVYQLDAGSYNFKVNLR